MVEAVTQIFHRYPGKALDKVKVKLPYDDFMEVNLHTSTHYTNED